MNKNVITFLRKKDLNYKKELGRGACGQTVLLYDDIIEENFVCKKYSPIHEPLKKDLFKNFIREIKLLHLLNHPNIVRVFNYYLYPDDYAGYILMEYIQGDDIEEYCKTYPEQLNQIFLQAIYGFSHLEDANILHRDIRPANLLVSNEGLVKIIDFGFGKKIIQNIDYDKSITLNWWCEPPNEFHQQQYNHSTEIYFLGKLFEKIIIDNQIDGFAYKSLLSKMCSLSPASRIEKFSTIKREILAGKFSDIEFNEHDKHIYRLFADQISNSVSKIEESTKYIDNPDEILRKLEACYKTIMLEEYAPSNTVVLRCILNGAYYHSGRKMIQVTTVKNFIDFMRSCSKEKQNIVLGNLHTRLDAIKRYGEHDNFDDDIPF